jgi:hypothetical protein
MNLDRSRHPEHRIVGLTSQILYRRYINYSFAIADVDEALRA